MSQNPSRKEGFYGILSRNWPAGVIFLVAALLLMGVWWVASTNQEKAPRFDSVQIVSDNLLGPNSRVIALTWKEVPGAVKYNIYHKTSANNQYPKAAVAEVGVSRIFATVINPNEDNFFRVNACKNPDDCIPSNEVALLKKPNIQ